MIGGPTGAKIGWMVGSAVGGMLSQQDQHSEGPRLGDLSVQASTYGGMKPILYGTMRVNGNVIFCTDKREVATTTDQSGKGGPSVTSTTYTYNVDMAIAVCANQIAGIRKIWNNGKLIYDQSSGASISTVIASSTKSAGFKVYLGSETQLPDPTLEATLGVGNVPGYRGTAYVVFDHMDCPNGQIPQLSFEVAASVNSTTPVIDYGKVPGQASPTTNKAVINQDGAWHFQDAATVFPKLVAPGYVSSRPPIGGVPGTLYPLHGGGSAQAIVSAWNGSAYVLTAYDLKTGGSKNVYTSTPPHIYAADNPRASIDSVTGKIASDVWIGITGTTHNLAIFPSGVLINPPDPVVSSAFYNNVVYIPVLVAGVTYINEYSGDDGTFLSQIQAPVNGAVLNFLPLVTADGIYLCVFAASRTSPLSFYKHIGSAWAPLTLNVSLPDVSQIQSFWCTDRYAIVGPASNGEAANTNGYYLVNFNAITPVDPTVSSQITDICTRAGLPSAQLDTSSLTDTVTGYALTRVAAARASLDPLLTGFFIDGIESDGILKFRNRKSLTPVATISFDELAASQDGSAPGDPLPLQRTQEIDLPRSVAINYINVDADYQPGTEPSRRIVTASINDVVTELPLATNSARAATVASALLYDAWNERNKRTAALTRKYAHLDAGDVVTLEYPRGTFAPKRITKANDTGILIELELSDADGTIYTVAGTGASPGGSQVGISLPPPTLLELLDIPILRDADDNPGMYVAMNGLGPNWPGAVLYMGTDDASLAIRGGVSAGTVMGYAATALGNWAQGIMDQINSVTVTIGQGALSSDTRDNVLDKGTNAALLGSEIIQFTTATSLGNNQYQLSGLLRGVRGTESQAGTHVIGERFVMLQFAGLVRPLFDLSELNQNRKFRAITNGLSINSQISTDGKNTGAGVKPLNPVNLRRSTLANDITLTWDRRTRSSVTFPANGVDVPLFEASESYSVDVYSSNAFATIVRTIASSSPQITYTSAQQTADGLTPGAAVNVRVYQLGAAGRGYPLQGTI